MGDGVTRAEERLAPIYTESMMADIISLDKHRPAPGEFCVSITIMSDGEVLIEKDDDQLSTRLEVNWALAALATGIADLVEYKRTLAD